MKYDSMFRDSLDRYNPLYRHWYGIDDDEQPKYPAMAEYKEPPLFFHIMKYCFHAVFVLFGLLLAWEILF